LGLILLGNNLVNIVAASLVSIISLRLWGTGAVVPAAFLLTMVILIFAEVTPKTLAALHPERLALPAAIIYYPLLKICYPLIWLVNAIANTLLRLFGVRPEDGDGHHLTMEELRTLVDESGALLPQKRQKMLLGILELESITVDDIMVPHNEVTGIDLDDPWEQNLELIRTCSFTRLPVYRDGIDNVIGMLDLRRIIRSGSIEMLTLQTLESLTHAPYFVPEGTPLNRQLVQFQRTRQRAGLVVDEYGDIQGLVTLEDILEEIVGEFTTEPGPAHQDVQPDPGSNGFIVNASANIRALNRMMNWQLPTEGPKTLNGLILEHLEDIPKTGTGLTLSNYPVEILDTSDNVINSVRILPALIRQENQY
ncbi:MAG: HlyC/CorC family transporter, partial [Gammaproteobacteria bacterium]